MKKLRILLMLTVAIILFASSAYSQQKAIQGWTVTSYWSPVFCDGDLVDFLEGGNITAHYMYHFVHGVFLKQIAQLKGEVTSSTGEVFKISERDLWYPEDGIIYYYWKFNLIGDRGTHYIGEITVNNLTGEIVEIGEIHCK